MSSQKCGMNIIEAEFLRVRELLKREVGWDVESLSYRTLLRFQRCTCRKWFDMPVAQQLARIAMSFLLSSCYWRFHAVLSPSVVFLLLERQVTKPVIETRERIVEIPCVQAYYPLSSQCGSCITRIQHPSDAGIHTKRKKARS